jgi:hypothetical protein
MKKIEITDDSELFLVGFRINTDTERDCDFYTLYVDSERPIDCDGYPIIFFTPKDSSKALALSNCGCDHLPLPTFGEYAYIDIAQTIYEIGEFDKTDNTNILDSINMILDFVSMLHENRIQREYKKLMRDAANHFTFSYEIDSFFKESGTKRVKLVQALEWAIGATVLWAKYVY